MLRLTLQPYGIWSFGGIVISTPKPMRLGIICVPPGLTVNSFKNPQPIKRICTEKNMLLFTISKGTVRGFAESSPVGCIVGPVGHGGPQMPTTPAITPKSVIERVMVPPITHLIVKNNRLRDGVSRAFKALFEPCAGRELVSLPDLDFLRREFGISS